MVGGTRHHPSLVALLLYPEVEEYHTGTEYGIRNTYAQASIKFVDSMALMTDKRCLLISQVGLSQRRMVRISGPLDGKFENAGLRV